MVVVTPCSSRTGPAISSKDANVGTNGARVVHSSSSASHLHRSEARSREACPTRARRWNTEPTASRFEPAALRDHDQQQEQAMESDKGALGVENATGAPSPG